MRTNLSSLLVFSALCVSSPLIEAATVQLVAGVQSSELLDGINLTNDNATVFINADWTFDQGAFAGADCYVSGAGRDHALDQGCDFYAGYFKPLSENNAVSIQFTRHEYSNGFNSEWDFNDLSLSWQPNKKSSISVVYARDWLNRSFDTFSLKADTQLPLSENLGLNLSASIMQLESGEPVSNLAFAKASLSYIRTRWTTEFGIAYSDQDQERLIPFDVDEAELFLNISYRLY